MAGLRPNREKDAPLSQKSGEALIETLRSGCMVQGEKRLHFPNDEALAAAKELRRRGVTDQRVQGFQEACRKIGLFKDLPLSTRRRKKPDQLLVNEELQDALREAGELEKAILAKLAAK